MPIGTTSIASSHMDDAFKDAQSQGFDTDSLRRAMLALVVRKYLE